METLTSEYNEMNKLLNCCIRNNEYFLDRNTYISLLEISLDIIRFVVNFFDSILNNWNEI